MSERWTAEDLAIHNERLKGPRQSKYRAQRTEVDGVNFASKREAKRYGELRLLERVGEISGLELQVKMPIAINGKHVCFYMADFCYLDKEGKPIVEDCKGFRTDVYKLKKKMIEAQYGLTILET